MGDDFIILNHLILTAKFYIYRCKLNSVHPILRVYKARIKAVYQVERKIASRPNKLTKHTKKWEKLLAYVGLQCGCSSCVPLMIYYYYYY